MSPILQILRCAAPTNITVLCTYKYHGALHFVDECANTAVYKYLGALHLWDGAEHLNICKITERISQNRKVQRTVRLVVQRMAIFLGTADQVMLI